MSPTTRHHVKCITINTDASWHPESKVCGFAFYIVCDKFKITQHGPLRDRMPTITDAEIAAIANAIHCLTNHKDLPTCDWLIINTDCKPAISRIREGKTPLGKRSHHMWQKLITKLGSKNNKLRHVKAHTGKDDGRSKANEWCDKHAKQGMRQAYGQTTKTQPT